MADLQIDFADGPREGESLTLKNTWEYPEEIRVATDTGFAYYTKGERVERDGKRGTSPVYRHDATRETFRAGSGT